MRATILTLTVLSSAALLAGVGSVSAAEPTKQDAPAAQAAADTAAPDQAALEKSFAERLTGATMIGKYTVEGSDAPPKADRYRITRAVKSSGDEWLIASSVEYKGFGIPVELKIPIRWAGDTPVMQVTDMKVPGIGTFTARVLFYGDQYIGTWAGHGHGGTLWGKLVHEEAGKGATTHPVKP